MLQILSNSDQNLNFWVKYSETKLEDNEMLIVSINKEHGGPERDSF